MAETFHTQIVQRSRKRRQCSWCGELIEIGDPYNSYRFSAAGDTGKVIMHPECHAAMRVVAAKEGDGFEWSVGDFNRGCGCERWSCQCEKQPQAGSE
jgi:hypothetical protein